MTDFHATKLRSVAFLVDGIGNPDAGTEGQVLDLIQGLQQQDVSCLLLALQPSRFLESAEVPCPVEILGHSRVGRATTWAEMWRHGRGLARRGVQVAQTYMIDASLVGPPMLRLAGIPTLVSRRDLGYWYTAAYRSVLKITSRSVAGYVCNSQAVARVTREAEGVPVDRCHVIYNGLGERSETNDSVPELQSLKESGALIIGLVANIRPIKRVEDIIDAVALLPSSGQEVHVVIIGAGDAAPLRNRATAAGIGKRVHLLGSRSDVATCLQYVDVGALCSESEGFSNTLLEYMRAGIPSVCTDAGGNPEAIRHGETGFLYPVGDVQELGRALQMLLEDPERRSEMGAMARVEAVERYSTEAMVHAHMDLYRRILSGT